MDGQRDERPDPELLLKQNFPRESDKARGRLKIFFGHTPCWRLPGRKRQRDGMWWPDT